MKEVSKSVIEKIKEENIKPIPRAIFIAKNLIIWMIFVLSLVFGSVGVAIIVYLLLNNDSVLDFSLVSNIWKWIILSIPLAWLVLTTLFVIIAYYNFRGTDGGYKISLKKILQINLGIILVLGFGMYYSGISSKINSVFLESLPFYQETFDMREKVWMRPSEGYLAGEILSVDEDIDLKDLEGNEWVVEYEDANVKGSVKLEEGEDIKMIGKVSKEDTFTASEIRPWEGRGRRMQER
ncbi:MAG: hypothetical protein AB9915_00495 [Candidatus Dojkabacteria bacterium]